MIKDMKNMLFSSKVVVKDNHPHDKKSNNNIISAKQKKTLIGGGYHNRYHRHNHFVSNIAIISTIVFMMMMMMSVSKVTASVSYSSRRLCCFSLSTPWNSLLVRQDQRTLTQTMIGKEFFSTAANNKKATFATSANRFDSRPHDFSLKSSRRNNDNSMGSGSDGKNFRDDFRGTRVFVQGIPDGADWKLLKDHFRIAGEVVFASVSMDRKTGVSKGCGIVQYETTEMAQRAIQIMRNHPLDDNTPLYVRPDYQEQGTNNNQNNSQSFLSNNNNNNNNSRFGKSRQAIPSIWRCSNDDDDDDDMTLSSVDDSTRKSIEQLIQERDMARRQRNYDTSDAIRERLKSEYNVQMDDRVKEWWIGNVVPKRIMDQKREQYGDDVDGRWGKRKTPWRQIPTTTEQDANVNSDLVVELLTKRDTARKKKEFELADELLEQAKKNCFYSNDDDDDDEFTLLIHDDNRTFRVWTKENPSFSKRISYFDNRSSPDVSPPPPKSAREQCLDIIDKYNPEKREEVTNLLDRFPGREFVVLRKLKDKFVKN